MEAPNINDDAVAWAEKRTREARRRRVVMALGAVALVACIVLVLVGAQLLLYPLPIGVFLIVTGAIVWFAYRTS